MFTAHPPLIGMITMNHDVIDVIENYGFKLMTKATVLYDDPTALIFVVAGLEGIHIHKTSNVGEYIKQVDGMLFDYDEDSLPKVLRDEMEREDIPIEADIAVYYLQENLNLTDFRKEMKNKLPFIKRKTSKSAHTQGYLTVQVAGDNTCFFYLKVDKTHSLETQLKYWRLRMLSNISNGVQMDHVSRTWIMDNLVDIADNKFITKWVVSGKISPRKEQIFQRLLSNTDKYILNFDEKHNRIRGLRI